jgi:hypothetical protein
VTLLSPAREGAAFMICTLWVRFSLPFAFH